MAKQVGASVLVFVTESSVKLPVILDVLIFNIHTH